MIRRRWRKPSSARRGRFRPDTPYIMASLTKSSETGLRSLDFTTPDGRRRRIHLGRMSAKDAIQFRAFVEQLIAARVANSAPPTAALDWVQGLGAKLLKKVIRAGLID